MAYCAQKRARTHKNMFESNIFLKNVLYRVIDHASLHNTSPLLRHHHIVSMPYKQRMALRGLQVFGHHFSAHFLHSDFGHPAQLGFGLGRVAQQGFHLGGAEVGSKRGQVLH